mmetsp:Transcript_31084/g.36949  ORF Transcript_31084/g.36949 Transcript_31084/m.36949 type:complete len:276 (+) Transcript_31084:203-1030(+)
MMASSAKRFVLIPNVRNIATSALSSSASLLKDKPMKQSSPLLLRHVTIASGRIKKTAPMASTGDGDIPMVTMTKTTAASPPAVTNIAHVAVEIVTTKTSDNTSSSPSASTAPITDLLSAAASELPDTNTNTPPSSIQDNDSIHITASAVQQIHRLANAKRPDAPANLYLRVYVDAGGCSGFEYKFELEFKDDDDTLIDPDEDVIISASMADGSLPIEVVVDQSSLDLIQGCTVDFVREMIRSTFAILDNPQSESACGCGSSFAVKNFEKDGKVIS